MIQHRKPALLVKAARPVIEHLEVRQMLSATLSVSNTLLVFNAVQNSSASQTETLTLTNVGNAPLLLGSSAFTLGNDPSSPTQDSSRFTELNASSAPSELDPGQSFGLQLDYNANAVVTNSALLDISTNDPTTPTGVVTLRGIGTKGLGGSNQPSLATILQAYNIPTLVGEGPDDDNAATDSVYPNPPDPSSQEVVLQRLQKAGSGPVTIDVLASFTASGAHPYTLGIYTPGQPDTLNQLFTTPQSEAQSTYIQPVGSTSFDPGSAQFGFYFISNVQVTGRVGYSEDSLNTWDTTNDRKFRFFPMETPTGTVVPNTYIMTSTEYDQPIGYDFTNIVAIVSNVKAANAAPTAPAITLQNLNAVVGSNTMVFNRIQSPNSTLGDVVHDTGTLQVDNTGEEPLIINSYTLSSQWALVSPPTFPVTIAPGADIDLSIKFKATSEPSVPYNETDSDMYGGGGGVYDGTLTLNSNDPNNPAISEPLRGWWQLHSENSNEPGLQTLANLIFGYNTEISATQRTDLTESNKSGSVPTYYGQETVSAYWKEADPGMAVSVQQIAAYHTEGNTTQTNWYPQGHSGSVNKLFTTAPDDGQTLFPLLSNGSAAIATFSTTSAFGFKVDAEFSDDSLQANKNGGGGHHFRFYPLIDANGNIIPNDYLMAMDYTNTPENFDFQDNVYIVKNIRPVSTVTVSLPQTTAAPATPSDFFITSANGINSLEWAGVFSSPALTGYDVYRATSAAGPFTLVNSTVLTTTSFADSTAPATGTSYYQVTTVDSTFANQSLGVTASVVNTGTPVTTTGNGAPVAAPETVTTTAGTAVPIDVVADASDNANGTIVASTVTVTVAASHGLTSVDPTTGIITYSPDAGFTGIDTFQYTVGDTTGVTSAAATVTVNVGAVPVGNPVAANLSYTAVQGVALLINDAASATDTTATIDPTTVAITQQPAHGTATVDPVTGAITYLATPGYVGPDSIQYDIGDSLMAVSEPATISITVAGDGPVVSSFSTTASATGPNTIDVLATATDANGTITPSTVAVTTAPLHGTATVDPTTGNIIYTPTAGYIGADSLQYTVSDSNNLVAAPATLSLNDGVTINNTSARSLTFTDASNNKVTLAITGGGTAQVFFNGTGSAQSIKGPHGTGTVLVTGSDLTINNIAVTGTTITGALTISRKGTAAVELGNVSVDNAIGRIIAPTTILTGTLNVAGAMTQLQLQGATGATIAVGSAQATKAGFSLISGHFVDTSLASDIPVKLIKVTDWTVDATTDSITAPTIASLITTGNLDASLTTSGGLPFSLGTVRIGGQVDAEGWNVTGTTNSVVVGSIAAGFGANFSQQVNGFTLRKDGFAGTLNAASIGTLSITGDDTGTINAGSIRSAKIAGMLSAGTISLTNTVLPKINSLGRLTITGAVLDSRIISAGNIGAITAAGISGSAIDAGTANGVLLPSGVGNFVASATISSFAVTGRGNRFTNSDIGAQTIGSLNLGTITTGNEGVPFGVGAGTIASLSATLDSGGALRLSRTTLLTETSINQYLTAHTLTLGDFDVRPGL